MAGIITGRALYSSEKASFKDLYKFLIRRILFPKNFLIIG